MRLKSAVGSITITVACAVGLAGHTAAAEQQAPLASTIDKDEFADEICRSLDIVYSSTSATQIITERFHSRFPHLKPNSPDYGARFTSLWNHIAPDLICRHDSVFTEDDRFPQHFMKRIIAMKMNRRIFDEFLLYDYEDMPIELNMVEMVDGKRETLLDYVDKLIADPESPQRFDLKVLREVRDIIIFDYGAKKASELVDGQ